MTTIDILKKTKAVWKTICNASNETKNALLLAMADSLERNRAVILVENRADMEAARGHISGTKGSSTVIMSMAQAAKSIRRTRLLVNLVSINR